MKRTFSKLPRPALDVSEPSIAARSRASSDAPPKQTSIGKTAGLEAVRAEERIDLPVTAGPEQSPAMTILQKADCRAIAQSSTSDVPIDFSAGTTSPPRTSRFEAEYFSANYRDYDRQNPSYKLAHYRQAVERHMLPGVPRRLHDIGCAYGRFVNSLGSEWEAFGSDISRHAIDKAQRRSPKVTFRVADASRDRPFPGLFGAVTAFDMLEHVPDCDGVGDAARAQLVEGGVFVFVVPTYDGATLPLHRLLDRDPTHVHKRPRLAWLDWAALRFHVLEWHGIVRYLVPGGHYVHWTTHRFREHTPAILVACRRLA